MVKIIVVILGKGGVGKMMMSVSFVLGFVLCGYKMVVIDFDVGLCNFDFIMGCECCVVYDFVNVIQGEVNLNQVLIKDKKCENLFILLVLQMCDKDVLMCDGVEKVLNDFVVMDFEYIVCDLLVGIEVGVLYVMYFVDEVLIVMNLEVLLVCDLDCIFGILLLKMKCVMEGKELIKEYLLIMCYSLKCVSEGEMLLFEDISEILCIKLIGVVFELEVVLYVLN